MLTSIRLHCLYSLRHVWFAALTLFVWAQAHAGQNAIASAHPLASEAGMQILREGGNAFDAAIAVAAALAVVEPNSSGIGGGGFFLLHRAADDADIFVDARETAPAAAARDMFLDANGQPVQGLSRTSALAAGIPGEVAGMAHLAAKYGRLPLQNSLQPAIRLARDGFPLYTRLHGALEFSRQALSKSKVAQRNFLRRGEVPAVGAVVKQPELAKTLQMIAREGAEGFYRGEFARRLVKDVRQLGGIWTEEDLAKYRVKEREPLKGEYRGAKIVSAPPPSSGGVALIDALNILSAYDLGAVSSVTRKHLVVEALRRIFRDRADYLGDPDFVDVPVAMLTSPEYAAGQRTSLRLDRATPSSMLAGIEAPGSDRPNTTHFSVLDAEGNRAAATVTVNLNFGSGLMTDSGGFFLNNEMDDFSVKPSSPNAFQLVGSNANAIAPGKRMLSSMTPTFVENEKGGLIIGSPGGSYIISMVLLGTLEWLDGRSADEIVSLRRYHHQYLPDTLTYETGALSEEEKASLEKLGHTLRESPRLYGNMQVVTWDKSTGEAKAASDPRGAGGGLLY